MMSHTGVPRFTAAVLHSGDNDRHRPQTSQIMYDGPSDFQNIYQEIRIKERKPFLSN
jgi:hypothetical protein